MVAELLQVDSRQSYPLLYLRQVFLEISELAMCATGRACCKASRTCCAQASQLPEVMSRHTPQVAQTRYWGPAVRDPMVGKLPAFQPIGQN